jgi:hypothetical protein
LLSCILTEQLTAIIHTTETGTNCINSHSLTFAGSEFASKETELAETVENSLACIQAGDMGKLDLAGEEVAM